VKLAIAIIVLAWLLSGCGSHYDCSLAEISPDMPVKVKEACRAGRNHG
jgi:hypothetical protein